MKQHALDILEKAVREDGVIKLFDFQCLMPHLDGCRIGKPECDVSNVLLSLRAFQSDGTFPKYELQQMIDFISDVKRVDLLMDREKEYERIFD